MRPLPLDSLRFEVRRSTPSRRRAAWERYARYQRATDSDQRLGRIVTVLVSVAIGTVAGMRIASEQVVVGAALLAIASGLSIASVVVPSMAARAHERARREAARHLDACPSCEYDLRGLDAEPDACIVCPECGAAWRASA